MYVGVSVCVYVGVCYIQNRALTCLVDLQMYVPWQTKHPVGRF